MMLGWNIFAYVAVICIFISTIGAIVALRSKLRSNTAIALSIAALTLFCAFIVTLWITLQRPPLRTMGETRLWYSFFLLLSGLFTYIRWRYRWILSFSTMLSSVFMIINILKPEIHDQTLMPALQSHWFIPHVSVYMFSYALLGCATLLAIYSLLRPKENLDQVIERLLYGGIAFFTIGMLTGALWAKEAWGAYWSWDAKEAWAAATWLLYLLAIHLAMNLNNQTKQRLFRAIVIVAFLGLQMCWYGVNYLPSAAQSIHTYNQQ